MQIQQTLYKVDLHMCELSNLGIMRLQYISAVRLRNSIALWWGKIYLRRDNQLPQHHRVVHRQFALFHSNTTFWWMYDSVLSVTTWAAFNSRLLPAFPTECATTSSLGQIKYVVASFWSTSHTVLEPAIGNRTGSRRPCVPDLFLLVGKREGFGVSEQIRRKMNCYSASQRSHALLKWTCLCLDNARGNFKQQLLKYIH